MVTGIVLARAELPRSVEAPRQARELVKLNLDGVASPNTLDTIILLVSELVTNGVIHAETPIDLVVNRTGHVIRTEVHDQGRGPLPAPTQPQPFDEGGRGLCLVQALANTWGWHQDDGTTCVWFEVLLET